MSNLVPEKRVNKNGVTVTKHVRPAAATVSKPTLPAPSVPDIIPASASKPLRLTKKQLEQLPNSLLREDFKADHGLRRAITDQRGRPKVYTFYNFTASEAEIYSVLAVTTPENAAALLESGFRSGEEAAGFLRGNGLESLMRDRSRLADGALRRGIAPEYFFKAHRDYFGIPELEPPVKLFLDTAEACSIRAFDETAFMITRIARREISMDDIRTIGPARLMRVARQNDLPLKHLAELQAGTLGYDAEQMKSIFARFEGQKSTLNDRYSLNAMMFLADEFGYDYAEKLKSPSLVSMVSRQNFEDNPEERAPAMEYADQLGGSLKSSDSVKSSDVMKLFRAGIDPSRAAYHLDNGADVERVIAVEQSGTTSGVASGWL